MALTARLQLVLSEKDMQRIERIQVDTNAESKSSTVRAALDLYSLLLQERDAGSTLQPINQTEAGLREREILIL